MCTNSARLVDSLECYMDELVDCFEDFVKKSLFIISVAVGALIVMLGYVLKIVHEKTQPSVLQADPLRRLPRINATVSHAQGYPDSPGSSNHGGSLDDLKQTTSDSFAQESVKSVDMPFVRKDYKTSSAGANASLLSSTHSFEERVLRNIGLSSCSKSCMQSKKSIMRNNSTPRFTLPSMPTCIPNHHLSTPRPCSKFVASRNSCCSMCCADDDRR